MFGLVFLFLFFILYFFKEILLDELLKILQKGWDVRCICQKKIIVVFFLIYILMVERGAKWSATWCSIKLGRCGNGETFGGFSALQGSRKAWLCYSPSKYCREGEKQT